jgi:hypothetical protein
VVLSSLADLLRHSCELWDGQHPNYLEPEFLYRKDGRGIANGYRSPPRRDAPVGRLVHVDWPGGDENPLAYDLSDPDLHALLDGGNDYEDQGDYRSDYPDDDYPEDDWVDNDPDFSAECMHGCPSALCNACAD